MAISDYANVYKERGMRVLCISEHGNRGNVWEQAEVAAKYSTDDAKMIPIAAAEAYFVPDRFAEDRRNFHLILVAKDMTGFRQLNRILSEANLTGFYGKARVDFNLLQSLDYRHFICTTACVGGVFKDPDGEKYAHTLHDIFRENFYLEIQHHPQKVQLETNARIKEFYKQTGIPLMYAADTHYIRHEDAILRKELLLSSGIENGYEDEFDLYLPTAEEAYRMLLSQKIFTPAQIEEAMENTLIFRDFEGVSFSTEKKIPNSRPELTTEERNHLYKKEVCDGYIAKAGMPSKEEAAELHEEMDAVVDTGTADYFIAMKDIVDRGLSYGGVLTTTGRGSGVSFATNYALGFTSINRLKAPVKLYKERFISRERLASGSLPDLDLNMANVQAFEKAGKEILGEYGCLPMIAYGTNKALSAFKMLARARSLDFELSNQISNQIRKYELDRKHAIENNQDDPDYDVDSDVMLADYVDKEYLPLIDESKQYLGIITTLVPHPCAHLLLDKDIREEIGVIRVKAKSGNKEPVYCAYIDGKTADTYGYLKADFLRVTVVKLIKQAFDRIGEPVMSVTELIDKTKDDPNVWGLYAKGFTHSLNQCEKEKTTERVMRYCPHNIVELAAFVAAVRPGFKSMLETFVSRSRFSYGIPALDELLQTKAIPDSFLMFDEQILSILQAAGIPPADAYTCQKAIKKKKLDKVLSYKEKFKTGFTKKLVEQGVDEHEAEATTEKVWTIINDAASYMFCAAHALSMACDSLYAAYLKAYYPYELYAVILKTFTEKGNKEKVASAISEMRRYKNIQLTVGRLGQDNRDWYIDKEHGTISQSLSSIKYVSQVAAEDLYKMKDMQFDTFADVLRHLQMETCLNSRQIKVLIMLGYFERFGGAKKLMKLYAVFSGDKENDTIFNGKNVITKMHKDKTVTERMEVLKALEKSLPDEDISIFEKLQAESEFVGTCLSSDQTQSTYCYFIEDVDDTYGIKVRLYSVVRSTIGLLKIRRPVFEEQPFKAGDSIILNKWEKKPKYLYTNGKRVAIPDTEEFWIVKYDIVHSA